MKILLDTNILIYREQYKETPANIAALFQIASENQFKFIYHPVSFREIQSCNDQDDRNLNLSKIESYQQLEQPPDPYVENDHDFLSLVDPERTENSHDRNDNILLYAVYRNAASILVTNDRKLIKKGDRFEVKLDVDTVDGVLEYLRILYPGEKTPPLQGGIKHEYVYNLNIHDPIFDSLKRDYPNFEEWFKKISEEHRRCYITRIQKEKTLGSVMIYKIEKKEEAPDYCNPALPPKKRLKISTLIVSDIGNRIGEALLRLAFNLALKNQIDELYLTHFTDPDGDLLIDLLKKHGFHKFGVKNPKNPEESEKLEDVYVKNICPPDKETYKSPDPYQDDIKYYPSFCDNQSVSKFIIPIKPEYHDRFFPTSDIYQGELLEYPDDHIPEGYAILKAYLTNSNTKQMKKGDIVIFYKSKEQCLTTLGFIDEVYYGQNDTDKIMKLIRKRTVYSRKEVEGMLKKPLTIILFRWNTNLKENITLTKLIEKGIVQLHPRSIMKLIESKYQILLREGVIDESLTFD